MQPKTEQNLLPRNRSESNQLKALPETSYRALTDEMPQMVWSTRPDGYHDYYNRRWYEFTGTEVGSTDGDGWNGMFHPDDQEKSWKIWQDSLATGQPYEVEYRLRHHSGEYRWTLGRAMPIYGESGEIIRWIGTCTDIHEQRRLSELNALLSQELSHRIKNIFAVISALISLSASDKPQHLEFADTLRERINALGNAHEFVRPHSERSRPVTGSPTLAGMLGKIFSAYPAYKEDRLTIVGDDMIVDDQAATPIALVFHELATNAIKYGSLNNPAGRVRIECVVADEVMQIKWTELGVAAPIVAPAAVGFGSSLMELTIVHQLGGTIEKEWHPDGLRVHISLPANRIHR
jgi:PAS domain S-box-containing protein